MFFADPLAVDLWLKAQNPQYFYPKKHEQLRTSTYINIYGCGSKKGTQNSLFVKGQRDQTCAFVGEVFLTHNHISHKPGWSQRVANHLEAWWNTKPAPAFIHSERAELERLIKNSEAK